MHSASVSHLLYRPDRRGGEPSQESRPIQWQLPRGSKLVTLRNAGDTEPTITFGRDTLTHWDWGSGAHGKELS